MTAMLPQEVVDHIIDCVAEGQTGRLYKATLSSCTLVSHRWVARSSRCLLRNAEVGVLDFQAFLSAAKASERMSSYIQSLVVNGALDITPLLDDIFDTLPLLRSLELWSNYIKINELAPLATPCHRLTNLKLSGINLDSIPHFLRLFQHVDNLELRSIDCERDDDTRNVSDPTPLSVGRLILNACCELDNMQLLRSCVQPTAIFVNGFEWKDLAGVGLVVQSAAEKLEHINLMPTQDDEDSWNSRVQHGHPNLIPQELSVLARCPKLQSISLDLVDVPWDVELSHVVLSHIPPNLRRLRFVLEEAQVDDIFDTITGCLSTNSQDVLSLESLEFRGVCLGMEAHERHEALLDLKQRAQTSLPDQYRKIVTFYP